MSTSTTTTTTPTPLPSITFDRLLVWSNVVFLIAWLQIMYYYLIQDVPISPVILFLTFLIPFISAVFHWEQIQELSNGSISTITASVGGLQSLDIIVTWVVIIYLAMIAWCQHFFGIMVVLGLFTAIPFVIGDADYFSTDWTGYVEFHSVWHVFAGIFECVLLYEMLSTF